MNRVILVIAIVLHTTILHSNELHDAVKQNNIERVKQLLQTHTVDKLNDIEATYGHLGTAKLLLTIWLLKKILQIHNVDELDEDENTPLYIAATYGHLDIAKLLLERNADVNAQNKSGASSLFPAVLHGHTKMVKLLLEKGADVKVKDHYNNSVSILASTAVKNQYEIEDILIDYGAHIHRLHNAVARNTIDRVKELLKTHHIDELDENENTPLYIVATYGHLDIAKLLLERNADVNAQNKSGASSLFPAVLHGHTKIVKLLLKHRADVHVKDKYNKSVSMLTSRLVKNRYEIENMLIAYGAHISRLHDAAARNAIDLVKKLLKIHHIDECDEHGNTPLYIAHQSGNLAIEALLIKEGADGSSVYGSKNAAILSKASVLTQSNYYQDNTPDLLKIKSNLPAPTIDHQHQQLYETVIAGNIAQVEKMLTEQNSPYQQYVNQQDELGATPLIYAAARGDDTMVKLLLNHKAIPTVAIINGMNIFSLLADIMQNQPLLPIERYKNILRLCIQWVGKNLYLIKQRSESLLGKLPAEMILLLLNAITHEGAINMHFLKDTSYQQ